MEAVKERQTMPEMLGVMQQLTAEHNEAFQSEQRAAYPDWMSEESKDLAIKYHGTGEEMWTSREKVEEIRSVTGWLDTANDYHDTTSQFGEDGYIAAAFKKIGVANRWCFEVGASNGVSTSNTMALRKDGWNAVLIEGDKRHIPSLERYASDSVRVVNEHIGVRSLDRILSESGAPTDMDLGVIDIDGQDFWVWAGMQKYRPRLMLVEFSPYKEDDRLPPIGCTVAAARGGQAGIDRILDLGTAKGYTPLIATVVNILFVQTELCT